MQQVLGCELWRAGRCLGLGMLLLLAAVSLSGCGGSNPPTAEVKGAILFDGKPMVGGGQVMFVPAGATEGRAAMAAISKEDGTFELTTFDEGDGAIIGDHRVQIIQEAVIEYAVYDYIRGPEGEKAKLISPEKRISDEEVIPEVYGSPKSPLTAQVKEGTNEFTFELVRNP